MDEGLLTDLVEDVLPMLVMDSVQAIFEFKDQNRYLRWLMDEAETLYDEAERCDVSLQEFKTLAYHIGRSTWDHTLFPDKNFTRDPLRTPGELEHCPCDSGQRYFRCCKPLPDFVRITCEDVMRVAVEVLPAKKLKDFDRPDAPRFVRRALAERYLEESRIKAALKLLEGLVADVDALEPQDTLTIDLLVEVYERLKYTKKKVRFLEHLLEHTEGEIKAHLLQRQAAMVADQGCMELAWVYFQQAQREAPQDPGLIHLELVLLLSDHRYVMAKRRAHYWLAWSNKHLFPEHPAYELLSYVVDEPETALLKYSELCQGWEGSLHHLLRSPQQVIYELEHGEDGYNLFLSQDDQKAHTDWLKQALRLTTHGIDEHLARIEDNPRLLDSCDVLENLLHQVSSHPFADAPWIVDQLYMPLLERAERLLLKIIVDVRGPWSVRSFSRHTEAFLQLVYDVALRLDTIDEHNRAMVLYEHLLELDHDDAYGIRSNLVNIYLRRDLNEEALTLVQRFNRVPLLDTQISEVLALYRLGEMSDARQKLVHQYKDAPQFLDAFVNSKKQAERLNDDDSVCAEAHNYRRNMLNEWMRTPGALNWLRQLREELKQPSQ